VVASCSRLVSQRNGCWMLLIALRIETMLVTQNLLLPTPLLRLRRLDLVRQSENVLMLVSCLVRERTWVSWGRRPRSDCA
jgi:hypothetical protein